METLSDPGMEYGVARFVLPGQVQSGDLHVLRRSETSTLIAVIDGIGHGEAAASSARTAARVLESQAEEPVISLVQQCHENLKMSRGVVMSLAAIDRRHGLMTWLGVGNVQGLLLRKGSPRRAMQETLLLRSGVVGAQLPPLQASVLTVAPGDLLIFATDGIYGDFSEDISPFESPEHQAARILKDHCRGTDDALVLIAKVTGHEK